MIWFTRRRKGPTRRLQAEARRLLAELRQAGHALEPVAAATPRGRIAASVWGQAWCTHLESISDQANRLPRGRTYLRNGSVLGVELTAGCIKALVLGSDLYQQTIRVAPLPAPRWNAIRQRCSGRIGSVIELLQGRLSDEVMSIVTDRDSGLFPDWRELELACTCPDAALLCKHLAAVLYGVGARLDASPELLFRLRGVDHTALITTDIGALASKGSSRRRLDASALGDVFGIELAAPPAAPPAPAVTPSAPVPVSAAGAAAEPDPASIRALRQRLGLSRADFATLLGVSAQSVANWERSTTALRLQPRSHERLCALLRAHPSD